ncbi:MAG TPA: biotin-dependent carboxyltransferase family protein [Stellaceae bacterium]|nr:biotin-dependent carboxyltransferase family protein [Stellaceae bacterium]
MTPGLKVLSPGLHTTVQDLGRIGYQVIGVPVSGALDGFALRLANALVGNPQGMAALEILVSGPTFEIAADSARLALVGTGASLGIRGEKARVVAEQSVTVQRGDIIEITLGRQFARCYLAVEGGIAVPRVLGSASTYVRAALGGLNGRALQRDDVIPLAVGCASERSELRVPASSSGSPEQPIRVVLGPQHKYFRKESLAALLDAEFRVSKDADRMGMRLDGPALRHRWGWDIVSDAIATGSIQVPGSGQPIVLLADHQTTGGYPKIATVISADLPRLGRCRPGDPLRFVSVEPEAAEEMCRQSEREFAKLVGALEPAPSEIELDIGSLYGENLISGVTTGFE